MTYTQAVQYLCTEKNQIDLTTSRVARLLELFGNPQQHLKIINVVGTNGKGSVCSYLSAILQTSGYMVGVFSSPHLVKINESIEVNGQQIDDDSFAKLIDGIKTVVDAHSTLEKTTGFEILTVAAIIHFVKNGCKFAVLEAGLGGLNDATNLGCAILTVVTKISFDHTDYLGASIAEIITNKAGIISNNSGVVVAKQEYSEVVGIVNEAAQQKNCQVRLTECCQNVAVKHSGVVFDYKHLKKLQLQLNGLHQADNAAAAIEAAFWLQKSGYGVTEDNIYKGLKLAKQCCRLERLCDSRYIYIDGSHNVDGVAALIEYIKKVFDGQKAVFTVGVLRDKQYQKIVDLVAPYAKKVYTVKPDNSRALDQNLLAQLFEQHGVPALPQNNVETAVKNCFKQSEKNDIIFIIGSLYYVGYARQTAIQLINEGMFL